MIAVLLAGCSSTLEPQAWEPPPAGDTDGAPDPPPIPGEPTEPAPQVACEASTPTELSLVAADAEDLVSPARARAAILAADGSLAAVPIVRDAFVAYYPPRDGAADGGVTATADLQQPDLDPAGVWTLQVAVTSVELADSARPPLHVALVLDGTPQATTTERELVESAAVTLASKLHTGDRVTVLGLGAEPSLVLENHDVQGPDDPVVLQAIYAARGDAAPDLLAALGTAYDRVASTLDAGVLARVVYVGAGGAEPSAAIGTLVAAHAEHAGELGVGLVAAGVGDPGDYDARLVSYLREAGGGVALYLGDPLEVERAFGTEAWSTLAVSARDLTIDVELPPGFRPAPLAEGVGEPSAPGGVRDLPANRSLVARLELVTCLPAEVDAASTLHVRVAWRDPGSGEALGAELGSTFGEELAASPPRLNKVAAALAYADALLAWQAATTDPEREAAVLAALEHVEQALALLPDDPDLIEIADLLGHLLDP